MHRFVSFSLAVFSIFWLLVATDRKAWGYVDAGAGYLALQTFASVAAACGFFLRRRLKSLFGIKNQEQAPDPTGTKKTDSPNAA